MIADLPLQAAVDLRDVYRYAVFAENGKVYHGIDGRVMLGIFANRAMAGRLVFHRNDDLEVDGLLVWYRFNAGWTMDRVYRYDEDDENGTEIFISAAFADNPQARRWGIRAMILKEPDVIWCKLSALRIRRGKARRVMYPQRLLARLLKENV